MLAILRANVAAALLGLLAAILLVISVYQTVALHGFLWIEGANDKIDRLTIDNNELRFAAREAERLNAEQVRRIEHEQQEITNEISRDLTARLERLRSELRSKAPQGSAQRAPASPNGKAPGGVDEEAGLCLTADQLLRAAESEERHDQLITWVNEQLKIER